MVTAVHECDFRPVNETSNMERSCSEGRVVFLTGSYVLSAWCRVMGSTHAVKD